MFVPRFCYLVPVDTALVESRTVDEEIHLETFSVVMAKVISCYFSVGSTGKNRNSLACLRNAGFHFAESYCSTCVRAFALTCTQLN